MNWSRLHSSGNENVFKGSQLVSSILERHSQRFRSRAAALKFARQLFKDGVIKSVFGADTFEDSVQLYTWSDNPVSSSTIKNGSTMTSYPQTPPKIRQNYGFSNPADGRRDQHIPEQNQKVVDDVRQKFTHRKGYMSSGNNDYHLSDVENGFSESQESKHSHDKVNNIHHANWNLQRASTASSESSVDGLPPHHYTSHRGRDSRSPGKPQYASPTAHAVSRDHGTIPEEAPDEHAMVTSNGIGTISIDLDGSSSIPRSTATDTSQGQDILMDTGARRWHENQYSYSDNEKQLIEQMKRMKKEHSHILRTYEDRINKLMAKMHELRSIAEMLENSSTKSSPYGGLPTKSGLLNLLGPKLEQERKQSSVPTSGEQDPPPLPPRPGRGSRLYPNKPIVVTQAKMKQVPWGRVILKDEGKDELSTIWHTMMEPKIDPEEIERLFSTPEILQTDGATLYDDLIIRRGRSRQQLVSVYDVERSRRIVMCMRCLRATLTEMVAIVSSLDVSQINHDSLAELIENLSSSKEVEKILYHVRKKGAGQLDHPEYLVFELSKVDHFRDKLEFIRFRYKMKWHLFEIDQQLRELHMACDEISNSISLKNLLETVLSTGNYLNGGSEFGQADGFSLEILNKLKETHDRDGKGTLLEFVLKTYCQLFESEVDIGCPTRFRLPEPSNMRHAAQVSFEAIQDALTNLYADLRNVRDKLLDPTINKDTMRPMDSFRVTAENFFSAALEVIGEQEKVLQDTRDFFVKTTTFFMMDPSATTPQYFFQIWATFLHDCKYFWKLAHRRLAKERFELEFKYKGQMSACSLHGYGSFRAGVLNGMTSNPQSRDSTSMTSSQHKHINTWMESLENTRANLPPKPTAVSQGIERHDDNKSDHSQRSSSPKPLTSTPPTSSDVHKPMAKAPPAIAPKTLLKAGAPGSSSLYPNYENQSEYDRLVTRQPITSACVQPMMTTSAISESTTNVTVSESVASIMPVDQTVVSSSKKSQQFSLKTWLKREREAVRRDIEHDTTTPPQQYEQKSHHSSKPFTKLKNSMFSRFTGNSSSKKQDNSARQKDQNQEAPKPPPKPERLDRGVKHEREPSYDAQRNNYSNYNSPQRQEGSVQPDYPDAYVQSQTLPQGPTLEDVQAPPNMPHMSPYGVLDFSHMASGRNGLNNVPGTPTKGDLNNNDKYGQRSSAVVQPIINNTRDLGISDNYGQYNYSRQSSADIPVPGTPSKSSIPQNLDRDGTILNSAESKRVRGQAVPVYKAKIINNYENQGKFESTNAVRQQAEPVRVMRDGREPTIRGSGAGNRVANEQVDPFNPYAVSEQTYKKEVYESPARNEPPVNHMNGHDSSQQMKSSSGYRPSSGGRYQDRRRQFGGSTNDNSTPVHRDSRPDNQRYLTPGNRAPMNAQSITSLIDRYDKQNNNEESQAPVPSSRYPAPPYQESSPNKPITMTSTPVAPRKDIGMNNNKAEDFEPSPPLPPRLDHSRSDNSALSPIGPTPLNERYRHNDNAPPPTLSSPAISQGNNTTSQYGKYSTPNGSQHQSSFNSPSVYITPPSVSNYGSPMSYNSPKNNTNSSRYAGNDNDGDDGYRAQLRRAANNASAFDRYAKPSQYYPRSNNNVVPNGDHAPDDSTAVVQPTVMQPKRGVSYMAI